MEIKAVKCRRTWDKERLGDLDDHLEKKVHIPTHVMSSDIQLQGAKIAVSVIRRAVPDLSSLGPASGLETFLYNRDLIGRDDVNRLSLSTATGEDLTRIIINASFEDGGRGKHIVKSLYLALLDMFLDKCNQLCHNIAMNVLRENAVEELGLSPHLSVEQKIDLRSIATRIPQIPLKISTALELRHRLNLSSSSNQENPDLQSILMEYSESSWSLFDLVKAMMITQGVGQYTVKLLPFYKSYPVEVFLFLNKLGKLWIEFALFLGFSNDDIGTLRYLSSCDTKNEIKNFSKVWRMPNLEPRKIDEILHSVIQVANINLEDVQGSQPDWKVCFQMRDGTFTTQISHGDQEIPIMCRQLSSMASRHYPNMGDLRTAQGSGSSEHSSMDSDIHPLVRQQSQWSSASDVDVSMPSTSLSHLYSPYQRQLTEGNAPVPPHPTSSEPVQASSPGSNSKQEQYVCSKPSSLSITEKPSCETPAFEPVSSPSRSLGTGLYGEVLEVDYKGETYAAKEYRTGFISAQELKTIFAEKLIGLRNNNVVPYYGVSNIIGTGRYVVVMERLETNLASFIDTATKEIEPERKLSILHDVAKGLEYLHSQNPIIVHCDLKPRNVLLTAELTAKIADCGNCHVEPISIIKPRQEDTLYLDYLPPEATSGDECSHKQDVFAFGHLSIYLIIQHEPHPLAKATYTEYGELKARSEVERRRKYIDEASQKIGKRTHVLYSRALLEFIHQCLDNEAANRPPISEFRWRP